MPGYVGRMTRRRLLVLRYLLAAVLFAVLTQLWDVTLDDESFDLLEAVRQGLLFGVLFALAMTWFERSRRGRHSES
jgi:predicted outer membrane lipoprotein